MRGMGVADQQRMPAVSIDLEAHVESLRGFLIDLDAHYWTIVESGDDSARYAFSIAMAQVSQRITVLEEIVRHHGDDQLTLAHATQDEARSLEHVDRLLDGEFVPTAQVTPAALWARVRDLLAAVDVLMLAAARGACERDVEHDDAGGRVGVVLPLTRSGR
jgi:hypothetical protein